MRKHVEFFGGFEEVEIVTMAKLRKMKVRYVCTDQEAGVHIYEERSTGEFFGVLE